MVKWLIGIAGTVVAGILVWLVTGLIGQHMPETYEPPKQMKSRTAGLKITYPKNDDPVGREEPAVRGTTPYLDRNHYLVVTSPHGVDTVEDGPLKVSPDGSWTGRATFGSVSVGEGRPYTIRVLATNTTLPLGNLVKPPADGTFSIATKVTRGH